MVQPRMQELCARLKALASELEAAGGGAEGDERRAALAQGALVLMELKSLNRAVCLNTDQARTLPATMSRDVTCLQHRRGVTACTARRQRRLLPALLVAGEALQGRVVASHARTCRIFKRRLGWTQDAGTTHSGTCDMSGPVDCLAATLTS